MQTYTHARTRAKHMQTNDSKVLEKESVNMSSGFSGHIQTQLAPRPSDNKKAAVNFKFLTLKGKQWQS